MTFPSGTGLKGMERKLAPGSGDPPRGNLNAVEGSRIEIEVITRG
jgi:hypothetical protein